MMRCVAAIGGLVITGATSPYHLTDLPHVLGNDAIEFPDPHVCHLRDHSKVLPEAGLLGSGKTGLSHGLAYTECPTQARALATRRWADRTIQFHCDPLWSLPPHPAAHALRCTHGTPGI